MSLTQYDALKERVEKKAKDAASMTTRWEANRGSAGETMTDEDVMAAKFKAVMWDQGGFGDETGVEDAAEVALVLAMAVDQSFKQMSMCRLKQISVNDQHSLKDVVVNWLGLIDNAFKFYCGFVTVTVCCV